jgi:ABC-type Fe3+-hydroxamate transport system substrate-binding protein
MGPNADPPLLSRRAALRSLLLLLTSAPAACGRPGGRERTGPPERVASRTVFADELLWALGPTVQAKVVGLSPMADDPRYSTVAGLWPGSTPRLGPNPEELLALGPDLVIVASFSAPEYRAALDGKLEVLTLDDFTGFAGYLDNLAKIGDALGEVGAAAALRARFEARRAALEGARPPAPERPTIIAWDHGAVPGAATSFHDAAEAAGFVNLAAREGLRGHSRLDAEQLVAWDPEWIVVSCGQGSCADAVARLGASPGFSGLGAVVERRVIAIEPPYLGTVGEAMLELAERMQGALLERRRR